MNKFDRVIRAFCEGFEPRLEAALGFFPEGAEQLQKATTYSLMAGGKRLRPMLVRAGAEIAGVRDDRWMTAAVAIELVHTYSLIHDDLPAMDDDDLRRGRPTCHIAFDEATAILAADGLQGLAYEHITGADEQQLSAVQKVRLIRTLSLASGVRGMVSGQAIDEASGGARISLGQLEQMHRLKTGALITAALEMGALCQPGVSDELLSELSAIGRCLGLAFQVVDDILDIEGDTATLGKPQGSDESHDKNTYPALMGLEEARMYAADLTAESARLISGLPGDTSLLEQISEFVLQRDH